MKIYVASSWRNEHQPHIVRRLRRMGHEVYDFREPHIGPGTGGHGFHWSEIDKHWQDWTPDDYIKCLDHPKVEAGFETDRQALDWCDACVLVMPCGRSAHLELGYAIGRDKYSIIFLPYDEAFEPELMYRFADQICVTVTQIERALTVPASAGI